nr:hypothetical protein [Yersinia kristensenii]
MVLFNQVVQVFTLSDGDGFFFWFVSIECGQGGGGIPFGGQQEMGDRKDSLTFGNKPKSYNNFDLYSPISDSINERLMRATVNTDFT